MLKRADKYDAETSAKLALLLWPDHALEEFTKEMKALSEKSDAIIMLAYQDGEAVGFAQCQLRNDYVEGTSSSPVGYLEGLFVKEPFRKQGFAKQLVIACENWAKEKGCTEFASDCELTNEASAEMHIKLGFEEANRIICFTKKIGG